MFDLEEEKTRIDKQFDIFTETPNIFSIFKHERHEEANSNLLAWLLDPKEKHGLGNSFLKAFINQLNTDDKAVNINVSENVTVKREYPFVDVNNKKRRLDILVTIKNRNEDEKTNKSFLIIENKIDSSEHDQQLQAYQKYFDKNWPENSKVYVKLSPLGDLPSEDAEETLPIWKVLSYSEILDCLLELQKQTMPPFTRTIISNYIDYLRFSLCVDREIMAIAPQAGYQDIYQCKKDIQKEFLNSLQDMLAQQIGKQNVDKAEENHKYYIRFTTPKLNNFWEKTGKGKKWWDSHSYACEFILADTRLIFQLSCLPNELTDTQKKDLWKKFVDDEHEQIQGEWVVLRKESFVLERKTRHDLNEFLKTCEENLSVWQEKICGKKSSITFKMDGLNTIKDIDKLFDSSVTFKSIYFDNRKKFEDNKNNRISISNAHTQN